MRGGPAFRVGPDGRNRDRGPAGDLGDRESGEGAPIRCPASPPACGVISTLSVSQQRMSRAGGTSGSVDVQDGSMRPSPPPRRARPGRPPLPGAVLITPRPVASRRSASRLTMGPRVAGRLAGVHADHVLRAYKLAESRPPRRPSAAAFLSGDVRIMQHNVGRTAAAVRSPGARSGKRRGAYGAPEVADLPGCAQPYQRRRVAPGPGRVPARRLPLSRIIATVYRRPAGRWPTRRRGHLDPPVQHSLVMWVRTDPAACTTAAGRGAAARPPRRPAAGSASR